jgi:peptidyl-prolyl cis-trans isomerase A (cyclophilin A)
MSPLPFSADVPLEQPPLELNAPGEGQLRAALETSLGTIIVQLFETGAPRTVANFVGLATGARSWRQPGTGQLQTGRPLYDRTSFHRVVPNFMVQAGDPFSSEIDGVRSSLGGGGPGYRFADESSGHRFDRPGLLAMANWGPDTNGSQWFVTEVAAPHLNGLNTIFGEVVRGFEIVPKIARAPATAMVPDPPVVLHRVTISRSIAR